MQGKRSFAAVAISLGIVLAAVFTLVGAGSPQTARDTSESPSCPTGHIALEARDVAVNAEYIASTIPACVPELSGQSVETRIEPLYSDIAAELVSLLSVRGVSHDPREPHVLCWGRDDWSRLPTLLLESGMNRGSGALHGWITSPRRLINLSEPVCRRLELISYAGEENAWEELAVSVSVLAHEAAHIAGIKDEGAAECLATRLTEFTALRLGASSAYASELHALKHEYYNAYVADDPKYGADECDLGGSESMRTCS